MVHEFRALLKKPQEDWSMKLRCIRKHRHLDASMDNTDTTVTSRKTTRTTQFRGWQTTKFPSTKQFPLAQNFSSELESACKVCGSMWSSWKLPSAPTLMTLIQLDRCHLFATDAEIEILLQSFHTSQRDIEIDQMKFSSISKRFCWVRWKKDRLCGFILRWVEELWKNWSLR